MLGDFDRADLRARSCESELPNFCCEEVVLRANIVCEPIFELRSSSSIVSTYPGIALPLLHAHADDLPHGDAVVHDDPGASSSGDAYIPTAPVPPATSAPVGCHLGPPPIDPGRLNSVPALSPCPLSTPLRVCTWNCTALFTAPSGSVTLGRRRWSTLHRIARVCDVLLLQEIHGHCGDKLTLQREFPGAYIATSFHDKHAAGGVAVVILKQMASRLVGFADFVLEKGRIL